MIEKLTGLSRMNSNTPSRETGANRDKINELADAINHIEDIIRLNLDLIRMGKGEDPHLKIEDVMEIIKDPSKYLPQELSPKDKTDD